MTIWISCFPSSLCNQLLNICDFTLSPDPDSVSLTFHFFLFTHERIVSSCHLYFLPSHVLLIFNLGFPFTNSSFKPPITYSLPNPMGFPHSVQLLCIIYITGNHFSFNPFPLWRSLSLTCPGLFPVSLTTLALSPSLVLLSKLNLKCDYTVSGWP